MNLPSTDDFNIKDCTIAGDECVLITPKNMSVKWTEKNKIFRSSIWRKSDMYPISLGFKKFTNLGEQPEFEPLDDHNNLDFVRKLDGSLLIVSKYKGQLIVRTRGTVDATKLDNGHEIELLKQKYPKVFNNLWLDVEQHTILLEWTTPTNRIVLKETEEPCLWLIGIVSHKPLTDTPYEYFTQFELDQQALYMQVSRPERYKLSLLNVVEYLKDKDTIEGVVVYSACGQILKKVKTPRYLYLHRVFTGLKTLDNLVDLWKEVGRPEVFKFEHYIGTQYDWELVKALQPLLQELHIKLTAVNNKIADIITFVQQQDFIMLTRKQQAAIILEKYKEWSKVAFKLLDGKTEEAPEKLFDITNP